MPITACKGTVDILPDETTRWRQVEEAAHQAAQRFGYKELRTPSFEATELFVEAFAEDGEVLDKELYSFKDKTGRSISFRPDLTVTALRAAIEHGMLGSTLFKGYSLGEVWRYERPNLPRLRDAHQFGAHAVGSASPAVDAELVDLAMTYLTDLGLKDLRLEVNSIGCKRCRPVYQGILRDFFAGKDEVLCVDCERRKDKHALRILDCRREACVRSSNTAPTVFASLCNDCRVHFQTFKDYLGLMGHQVHGNLRLVHGTGYCSRTLFQIRSGALDADLPLCVGGRLDDLAAGLGGAASPGVSFSVGLERVVSALSKEAPPVASERVDVFLVGSGEEAERFMTRTLHQLRKRGFRAERDYLSRGLKNQQRTGERVTPTFMVLLGEEDARVATVQVLDVARGSQESVHANRLIEVLDFKLRREARESRERVRVRADEPGRRSRRDRGRDVVAADEAATGEVELAERGAAGSPERAAHGDERRRGDRRERGRGRDRDEARGGRGSHGTDESSDEARFAEWAATYAEAARQSMPRPERRVPFSNLALGGPDLVSSAAEAWAAAQVGQLEPALATGQSWPAAPLAFSAELPPRRPLPERAEEAAADTWLEELPSSASADEPSDLQRRSEGNDPGARARHDDDADLDDDVLDDGGDGDEAGGDGEDGDGTEGGRAGQGEKRRRSSRRGGRRHGRRRSRSSKG